MLRVWCTALFAAAIASAAACATATDTSTLPKYTGIRIDATQLFSVVGCGKRDGQAYKYYAKVNETNQSGVFDCYADAVFQVAAGNYTISIRTFDELHWDVATSTGVPPEFADTLVTTACTAVAWDRAITTAHCPTASAPDASPPSDAASDATADALPPADATADATTDATTDATADAFSPADADPDATAD